MRYCPKYKHFLDESQCEKCKWNKPITLDGKINCTHPIQLIWNGNLTSIIKEGDIL